MELIRKTTIQTPAKINLFIDILNRRTDGYHELRTDLLPVSLFDQITFSPPTHQQSELICNKDLGRAEENLVVKAIRGLETYSGKKLQLTVNLEKNIPTGGGLGGGSGNAAGTLVTLNRLFDLHLAKAELIMIASKIGADVPFFIQPKPSFAEGIGDILTASSKHEPLHLLLIYPGFPISTSVAYADCYISGKHTEITDYSWQHLKKLSPEINDFWTTLIDKFPVLKECRYYLLREGAAMAGLSGSGSTVYGIFPEEKSRDRCYAALSTIDDWRCFRCESLNSHAYL
jgi:4-diphosphocytidyl-2-C-methyl-D-erythritol kinase